MNNQFYKDQVIRVEDKKADIPLYSGRREKCYNNLMDGFFTSIKNNFGPIKIKKSLRKRYEPY